MAVEIDHVLILTDIRAPEGDELVRFGLVEGPPNRHPGQGTANRRFFFHNAFLELVWVDNIQEAQSPEALRTGLWQRWWQRAAGASPTGVGFRPAADGPRHPPFASWTYRPPYLPPPLAIEMAANSSRSDEPLLFFLDFARPATDYDAARRPPLTHQVPLEWITRVRLSASPQAAASPELTAAVAACDALEVVVADAPLVELGYDHERLAHRHDFRPTLPLVLCW